MTDEAIERETNPDLMMELTAEVVAAYVGNNSVNPSDLSTIISDVHKALSGISAADEKAEEPAPVPAVNPKKSVTRNYIICLEDGQRFQSLKRHLTSKYNMTPEEYRAKWGLPADYPMVSPAYSERRSKLAKEKGLGRKKGTKIKR